MSKINLSAILRDYLATLRSNATGRIMLSDVAIQIALPVCVALVLAVAPPSLVPDSTVSNVADKLLAGVPVVASLMCAVAVMVFQLRVQLSSHDGPRASDEEKRLVDEVFSDVMWSVVAGFSSIALVIVGGVVEASCAQLTRILVSAAVFLAINMLIASLMCLKRMRAAYVIISRVWEKQ